MPHSRDPVSVLLDRGARQLLERAYRVRSGVWVNTRLADPSRQHLDWAQDMGLDSLLGPDDVVTQGGTHVDAHTRWGRAFMRSLWYQHKWYGDKPAGGFRDQRRTVAYSLPLQVEWGRRMPAVGIIPAGRAVRVRIATGGATKLRVVQAKPDSARIFADDGSTAGRWSDPAGRDWA
jgi:hypothetical protein